MHCPHAVIGELFIACFLLVMVRLHRVRRSAPSKPLRAVHMGAIEAWVALVYVHSVALAYGSLFARVGAIFGMRRGELMSCCRAEGL